MAQKVLGFDDVALLIEDINEDTEYLKTQVDGKAPLTHGHNAFNVTFDDGKTLPEKLDEVAGGGQIDLTDYVKKEVGKGLSTNDYDNVDKGKVDKLGTAALTTNAKTAFEAINELDDTIKDLPYTRTTIHNEVTLDANQWLTDGYTKTNAQTLNLPDDLATGERAGILFFMSENKDDPTGIQLFYCMQQQGDVLNKIYSRVVSNMNTNPSITPWGKKLSPKDLEVYQKVIDNTLTTIDKTVPGSINELNDKKVDNTDAVISNSLSMGRKAGTVVGTKSTALGIDITASGLCSAGFGHSTQAIGDKTHAEGNQTIAEGESSHAEGVLCKATKEAAHAEGGASQATGEYAHAEGSYTVASGKQSHAEGGECISSGFNSHAEGFQTEARGVQSHAEGANTLAIGLDSHVEGKGTIAAGIEQHVQGTYNELDNNNRYLHIVGIGTKEDARTNGHTIDRNGNSWYKGDVYVGGTSQDNGNKLLSTADIRFNAAGKLVVTINGVTKTFNPA